VKKTLWIVAVLALASLVGWQVYQKTKVTEGSFLKRDASAVAVEVAPVEVAPISDMGRFTGTLLSRARFVVAPKVPGRLEKLFVNVGDSLKNGQLIALLDDDEFVQQVEQAQAELNVARANLEEAESTLEIAQRELERTRTLRQKQIISQSELEAAEAEYSAQAARQKVALAQVAQKDAELKAARVRLSYTKIRASWEDGSGPRVLGERFVDEGAMLAANAPIVSVLDISSLTAVVHIAERDYFRVRQGLEARMFTDALPERVFTGTVARIAPLLRETSREARVEIDVPNTEGLLKPGMFVRVEIEFASRKEATVVPVSALIRRDGQQGVFVADLEEKRAHFVPVTLGIMEGGMAEVAEPHLDGWVVTLGQHLLEDGSAIVISGDSK
jgi:RND family efflux transporter MFP subunit